MVKRSGVTEPFSREKIVNGVRKACQGRPVGEDHLALLAQRVEETIRSGGSAEVDAYEIGLAILGPLRELDEVAYLRFASVYQAFESLEDFESAITSLRADREDRDDESGQVPDEAGPVPDEPGGVGAETGQATTETGPVTDEPGGAANERPARRGPDVTAPAPVTARWSADPTD